MPNTENTVVDTHQDYFTLVSQFHRASPTRQVVLLRGPILARCGAPGPVGAQNRLRNFWYSQASRLGLDTEALKIWV